MPKETIDLIVAGVQVVTLIAVIIYVYKTWQLASATTDLATITRDMASATSQSAAIAEKTLQEMREMRDQEIAPYVIAYFDSPLGKSLIYLVVKNIGKSVANSVKLDFDPPLQSSLKGIDIANIPFIRDGIGSMPPGYEIRTLFDGTISYLRSKNVPSNYSLGISYFGGIIPDKRGYELKLDLNIFKDLSYTTEKGLHNLVQEVEKLVGHNSRISQELQEIAESLNTGVWLRNPDFTVRRFNPGANLWGSELQILLKEIRTFWALSGKERTEIFSSRLQTRLTILGERLLTILSQFPHTASKELREMIIQVARNLSELGKLQFYIDGGASDQEFNSLGDLMITSIDKAIKLMESDELTETDNEGSNNEDPRPPERV
jgi:PAS domain-containing protein